ncbi:MAG: alpha/beta hydrolase [Armatimonadetes bacterium]|nr:alpha/beta hydrolase [Armatimonadota bacterium]
MATAAVNGTNLYFEETGNGTSLLLIHGMCGDARVWEDQVRRLSAHFRCIAYDRRGHTRSPLGEITRRSVELHADDAAALIQALHIGPCLMMGSSGGARIGVDVLRRYPQLVTGAVLSEPPLFALDPEGARAFVAEIKTRLEHAVAAGGSRAAVDAFFDCVCPGLWRTLDEARRERYRANHVELFGDLRMQPYQITPNDLSNTQTPCLVIRGSESHPFLRHVAELLVRALPHARLLELAGAGHVTYAEKPEEFARAVTEFGQRSGAS